MTTQARTLHDSIVYYDGTYSAGAHRWLDAIGPNVVKNIEEFQMLPVDDTTGLPTAYTTTLVNASTVALTDVAGGALLITAAGAENDGANIQGKSECFSFAAAYPFYMGIKFQLADADQSDFLFGVCIHDTTLLGGMTDGIYFQTVDATAAVTLEVEKDSTATSVAVATLTDATDMTLELAWDGTALSAWVDNVQVASAIATTNLPDDELLAFSIAFLDGEAAGNTATIKWARMIQIQE